MKYIAVIDKKTKEEIDQIDLKDGSDANRVLEGMSINLNHDLYKLEIREKND